MYSSKYSKITNCSNCNSNIDNNSICNTCGMEILDSDIIFIEESLKKNYSGFFSRRQRKHNPYTYCENWLLQLQGKESVNISSENFNRILELAKSFLSQNNDQQLSCTIIRGWLKSLSLSKYNSHITWLRKEIESACNIKSQSYELTNEEIIPILNCFSEIQLLKSKKFRLHYPFLIAKILPLAIKDKSRLDILLSNIHFQNEKTLAKNEHIWRQIKAFLNI